MGLPDGGMMTDFSTGAFTAQCKNPAIAYNDLASWRYSEMPHALGCDGWFTARVTTCGEFDQALKAVEQESTGARNRLD
jgi:TPP-dependent 2-oxoacid decarboxylase